MAKFVKVKYSSNYKAILKRIKNLPKKAGEVISSGVKRDALMCMKNFHEGIKNNSFGLEKLADGTIKRKSSLGMERPTTPLYGKGDSRKKDSYVNMLRIKKIENGYLVYPSKRKHYSGDITLNALFEVHEYGTIITQKRGKKKVLIRIPPRPALLKAFQKTMQSRKTKDTAKMVQKAITGYVKSGKDSYLKLAKARMIKGLEKYEKKD